MMMEMIPDTTDTTMRKGPITVRKSTIMSKKRDIRMESDMMASNSAT